MSRPRALDGVTWLVQFLADSTCSTSSQKKTIHELACFLGPWIQVTTTLSLIILMGLNDVQGLPLMETYQMFHSLDIILDIIYDIILNFSNAMSPNSNSNFFSIWTQSTLRIYEKSVYMSWNTDVSKSCQIGGHWLGGNDYAWPASCFYVALMNLVEVGSLPKRTWPWHLVATQGELFGRFMEQLEYLMVWWYLDIFRFSTDQGEMNDLNELPSGSLATS